DRLHFALFGTRVEQTDIVPNYLPASSGDFVPNPPSAIDYRGLAKLSWKPSRRDLVEGGLIGRDVSGERTGQTGYEDAAATIRTRNWGLSGNLTWQRSWVYANAIGTGWGGDVRLDSRTGSGALFIQDHATIGSWLSLNPGLRFGTWSGTLISPAGQRIAVLRDHGVEPRIGVALKLDPQNALIARAHLGRYHQPVFAGLFDRAGGADVYHDVEIWSYLGTPPSDPTMSFTLPQRDSLAAAGLFRLDEIERL